MKLYRKFLIVSIFYILIINSKGYRILGIFPYSAKSHDIFCQSLMVILAKGGHQVDVITTREFKNPPKNYTTIYNLANIMTYVPHNLNVDYLVSKFNKDPIWYLSNTVGNQCCNMMKNNEFKNVFKKLKNGPAYDLLITEIFTINCFMGIAHYLKVPMITLSPQILYPWVEEIIGSPGSSALYPHILSQLTKINSFWDRLQNTIQKIIIKYRFYYYTNTIQTDIMRESLGSDVPSIDELQRSSALTLTNTHHSMNGIRPSIPALIEVGGLHISEDTAIFTPELQKWMDDSKNGVVYFSLGTVLALETLSKETIIAFYSAFKKLTPIRVLIRVKNSKLLPTGIPKNVKILPWIPQIPVLNHKNTRVFITHCGLLSSQEAFYFGIPVIGIPIILDQMLNMNTIVEKNMGIKINVNNITENILDEALNLVLYNSTYRKAAKYASNIFKDRPMNAKKTAIYWIEYVARNGPILKSPSVNLHWIQNELLDVYGFCIITFILIFYSIIILIKMIFNFYNRKKIINLKKKNS